MELTVLESTLLPAKPVLAVSAGAVRRQAKLEANQPFVIPNPGGASCELEVSVFQQIASQTLRDDGADEAQCSIPVRNPTNEIAGQVKLCVRRCFGSDATRKTFGQDDVGMTKDYLERHQLQHHIQSLIQDILREQPAEPYKHMVEQLKRYQMEKQCGGSAEKSPRCLGAGGRSAHAAPTPPASHEGVLERSPTDAVHSSDSSPVAKAVPADAALQPRPPVAPRPPEAPRPAHVGRRLRQASGDDVTKTSADADVRAPSSSSAATLQQTGGDDAASHAPTCTAAELESFRKEERKRITGMLVQHVVKRATERIVERAEVAQTIAHQAKVVVRLSLKGAAARCSDAYHQALTRHTCAAAFRGAVRITRSRGEWAKEDLEAEEEIDVPQPIVSLKTTEKSWGQWLAGGQGNELHANRTQ